MDYTSRKRSNNYLAEGMVIPHGQYDLKYNNNAYVNIGVGKGTSEFACDSIRVWWGYEKFQYWNCT